MPATLALARHVLHTAFGHAEFRPLQRRIVHHALAGRDVLAVLPTGGGKSICYQVPALLERHLTLVVSPLIALMQDQVAALLGRGIAAAALNSDLDAGEQHRVLVEAAAGRLRLLYAAPERLSRLCDELRRQQIRVGRLAIDEAHCIVEWGHDFRPGYRVLGRARRALGMPPCLALTGSATPDVRREIRHSLGFGRRALDVVGSFDRPNLRFEVIEVAGRDDRLARLCVMIRTLDGSAIVYAPTRNIVEALARVLRESGVVAAPYHAGMTPIERRRVLGAFLDDSVRVVVATCAFGMGIDKPAVRLVAHWSLPATPESYYQEAGRAGRDGHPARCVLLFHPGDGAMPRRQLAVTFPDERLVERIWVDPALRARQPASVLASVRRLEAELRPRRGRGMVDWRAVRRRRRQAYRRLDWMLAYARGTRCRRSMLLGWFGEAVPRCSGCDRCAAGARRERFRA
jgi:ATP-dependent DNA helicase RecQ